jgi:hypothetical protein
MFGYVKILSETNKLRQKEITRPQCVYFLIFLFSFLIALAPLARAEVKYAVVRDGSPSDYEDEPIPEKSVYVFGGYNFQFANDFGDVKIGAGRGASAGLGFWFAGQFRTELAYEGLRASYRIGGGDWAESEGHFGFLNFIFDAKLPREYRLFKTNPFAAFAGLGAGGGVLGGNARAAYNMIGGLSIEISRTLALQIAYKYVKMLPCDLGIGADVAERFAPGSHNVTASVRLSF